MTAQTSGGDLVEVTMSRRGGLVLTHFIFEVIDNGRNPDWARTYALDDAGWEYQNIGGTCGEWLLYDAFWGDSYTDFSFFRVTRGNFIVRSLP
jgi:hypothetical protein